jgi:hypothetical protein
MLSFQQLHRTVCFCVGVVSRKTALYDRGSFEHLGTVKIFLNLGGWLQCLVGEVFI